MTGKKSSFLASDLLAEAFWSEEDYRDFLNLVCENELDRNFKTKAQFAKALGLSASFMTKVFSKNGHLSHEQIETLARALKMNDVMISAFLDKLTLARSTSTPLRKIIRARILQAFDQTYALSNLPAVNKSSTSRQPSLNNFKLMSVLFGKKLSLSEISKSLKTSEERAKKLLENFMREYSVEKENSSSTTLYWIDIDKYNYSARQPGSTSMRDLSFAVRRLANYSLELREPIDVVDEKLGEHHVSGSFIVPLGPEEMKILKQYFSDLCTKMQELNKNHKRHSKDKFVGICFDLFDAEF